MIISCYVYNSDMYLGPIDPPGYNMITPHRLPRSLIAIQSKRLEYFVTINFNVMEMRGCFVVHVNYLF